MSLTRTKAATLAVETATSLKRGHYTSANGDIVMIGPAVKAARANTVLYPPETAVETPISRGGETVVEVHNETTLAAAYRLHLAGLNPVALNFASAKNPGGGFLNGARAQEESLCRNSALFACLEMQEYYQRHRDMGGGFYTNYTIYSPAVPVLRDEANEFLDEPWPLAFVTGAAPNARALKDRGKYNKQEVESAFEDRIRRVMSIGAKHGHPSIVLGAWGCGAFGNDTADIAPVFARVLKEFEGVYQRVIFAVLDTSDDERTIAPFRAEFG